MPRHNGDRSERAVHVESGLTQIVAVEREYRSPQRFSRDIWRSRITSQLMRFTPASTAANTRNGATTRPKETIHRIPPPKLRRMRTDHRPAECVVRHVQATALGAHCRRHRVRTYDAGPEPLLAKRFVVTDRRVIYIIPAPAPRRGSLPSPNGSAIVPWRWRRQSIGSRIRAPSRSSMLRPYLPPRSSIWLTIVSGLRTPDDNNIKGL